MKTTMACMVCLLGFALLGGCAQYNNERGVAAEWQSDRARKLTKGKTTRAEVLQWLGPPSQVIALDDETVFYYLFERSAGVGLVLLVYNRFDMDTRYDRAIFFFDGDDLLTDFSTRAGVPADG
jgi:outer membrane protein assembly factor BamE (lipoprotein component of BamABCDE complex)